MVEQLQRYRDVLPSDVMIEPELGIAHARAAAVADHPLDRMEDPLRGAGQHLNRPVSLPDLSSAPRLHEMRQTSALYAAPRCSRSHHRATMRHMLRRLYVDGLLRRICFTSAAGRQRRGKARGACRRRRLSR
jgi:hypothetical protein